MLSKLASGFGRGLTQQASKRHGALRKQAVAQTATAGFSTYTDPVTASWQRQTGYKKFPQTRMPYDGATAASYVAYAWSDQAFIYPITPATAMGDSVANWAGAVSSSFSSFLTSTTMQARNRCRWRAVFLRVLWRGVRHGIKIPN